MRGTAAVRREIADVCRGLRERGLIAGPEGAAAARRRGDRSARRASTEVGLHLRICARRPDVAAVVHAHPPTATGFGVAGANFITPVLPEIILQVDGVPLVPCADAAALHEPRAAAAPRSPTTGPRRTPR